MRYVVRRLNWQEPIPGRYIRLPGWYDLAKFETADEAEADRREREGEVRATINPFACGDSFAELTSLPAPVLYDWLLDAGLEPPPIAVPLADWSRWWAATEPLMSAEQFARSWDGLNVLRFYEVAECTASGDVYAVLETGWDVGDYNYGLWARYEGGRLRSVHSERASADRALAELGTIPRYEYEPLFHAGARREAGRDPFVDPKPSGDHSESFTDVPAGELAVVSVPHGDTIPPGRPAFLVVRLSWAWSEGRPGRFWRPTDSVDGVPVAAFADRSTAETYAWGLDAAARPYLNPFRFGHPANHSTIEENGFKAMLRATGLVPPPDDWQFAARAVRNAADSYLGEASPSWFEWWAAAADSMSQDQWDTVWDMLDHLRFHVVIDVLLSH